MVGPPGRGAGGHREQCAGPPVARLGPEHCRPRSETLSQSAVRCSEGVLTLGAASGGQSRGRGSERRSWWRPGAWASLGSTVLTASPAGGEGRGDLSGSWSRGGGGTGVPSSNRPSGVGVP
ncbi:hypothetical protein NDU88_005149 [Pleurodeles waltl]|uniref:Uncharacterized protein n=1 Tax=Pleurodeles waltl TaxID=8319 RepID=A0AAV7NPE2_PLEWA|nr:hypothetical protein NDU88_005149 [Pleurodeles waltl]